MRMVSVRRTGCLPYEAVQEEINYQLNLAMKEMFDRGARRFRTTRVVNTGDHDRLLIQGRRPN
jgi:hypothetical protein